MITSYAVSGPAEYLQFVVKKTHALDLPRKVPVVVLKEGDDLWRVVDYHGRIYRASKNNFLKLDSNQTTCSVQLSSGLTSPKFPAISVKDSDNKEFLYYYSKAAQQWVVDPVERKDPTGTGTITLYSKKEDEKETVYQNMLPVAKQAEELEMIELSLV